MPLVSSSKPNLQREDLPPSASSVWIKLVSLQCQLLAQTAEIGRRTVKKWQGAGKKINKKKKNLMYRVSSYLAGERKGKQWCVKLYYQIQISWQAPETRSAAGLCQLAACNLVSETTMMLMGCQAGQPKLMGEKSRSRRRHRVCTDTPWRLVMDSWNILMEVLFCVSVLHRWSFSLSVFGVILKKSLKKLSLSFYLCVFHWPLTHGPFQKNPCVCSCLPKPTNR